MVLLVFFFINVLISLVMIGKVIVFILFFMSKVINVLIKVCRKVIDVIRFKEYFLCFCRIVLVLIVNLYILLEFFIIDFILFGVIFF